MKQKPKKNKQHSIGLKHIFSVVDFSSVFFLLYSSVFLFCLHWRSLWIGYKWQPLSLIVWCRSFQIAGWQNENILKRKSNSM